MEVGLWSRRATVLFFSPLNIFGGSHVPTWNWSDPFGIGSFYGPFLLGHNIIRPFRVDLSLCLSRFVLCTFFFFVGKMTETYIINTNLDIYGLFTFFVILLYSVEFFFPPFSMKNIVIFGREKGSIWHLMFWQ